MRAISGHHVWATAYVIDLDVCYLVWVRTYAFSCWDDVCTWLMTAGRCPSTGLDPMPFRVKVVPNEQPPGPPGEAGGGGPPWRILLGCLAA